MPSVPPAGGSSPSQPTEPENSDNTPAPPAMSGGSGGGMTAFMESFTPEQRRKFMNILVQNIVREIQKASKKALEELRRERDEIERGS